MQEHLNTIPQTSKIYVQKVTSSLVREYLYKKDFKSTLKCLHGEKNASPGICDRRVPLAKELGLEPLLKENKKVKDDRHLDSMLEVLVKTFLIQHPNLLPPTNSTSTQTKHVHHKHLSTKDTQTTKSIELQTGYIEQQSQVELNSSREKSGDDSFEKSYSSEFLDPEQLASPPPLTSLTTPTQMSQESQGSKSGSSPRFLIRSQSSKTSLRDEKEDEDYKEYSPTTKDNPVSSSTSPPKTFDNEFQVIQRPNKVTPSSDEPVGKMSLAESLLQSKQNILAQGCLTSAEINRRSKTQRSFSEDSQQSVASLHKKKALKIGQPSDTLELCDIEDEDLDFGENEAKSENFVHIRNIPKPTRTLVVGQLDLDNWRKLKAVVVGSSGFLQEGWIGQGFVFNPQILYGLVQKKGGPCGVLAVVQALLLRNLIFGSKYASSSLPLNNDDISFLLNETENSPKTKGSYSSLIQKRSEALRSTLVEILWRCADQTKKVIICLQGNEPGAELVEITALKDLQEFVDENMYRFDCLGLVYSSSLTRGIDGIQEDMDFPDSNPLIAQHGYCSQELVNLLLHGKCISNVFDNKVSLDGKTLYGISTQSDIGFLSLFEHYGSCEVGSFMKSPKYPVWIVCSESHFSILFSSNSEIISRDKERIVFQDGFDLYYYDGLAKQQQPIRLTISFDSQFRNKGALMTIPTFSSNTNSTSDGTGEANKDHLIPPLEKCIRTKWKNATISWNETEPLL